MKVISFIMVLLATAGIFVDRQAVSIDYQCYEMQQYRGEIMKINDYIYCEDCENTDKYSNYICIIENCLNKIKPHIKEIITNEYIFVLAKNYDFMNEDGQLCCGRIDNRSKLIHINVSALDNDSDNSKYMCIYHEIGHAIVYERNLNYDNYLTSLYETHKNRGDQLDMRKMMPIEYTYKNEREFFAVAFSSCMIYGDFMFKNYNDIYQYIEQSTRIKDW